MRCHKQQGGELRQAHTNQRTSEREGARMRNGDGRRRITNRCKPIAREVAREVERARLGRAGVIERTANRWGGSWVKSAAAGGAIGEQARGAFR